MKPPRRENGGAGPTIPPHTRARDSILTTTSQPHKANWNLDVDTKTPCPPDHWSPFGERPGDQTKCRFTAHSNVLQATATVLFACPEAKTPTSWRRCDGAISMLGNYLPQLCKNPCNAWDSCSRLSIQKRELQNPHIAAGMGDRLHGHPCPFSRRANGYGSRNRARVS